MTYDSLATIVDFLKDSQLVEDSQLAVLDELCDSHADTPSLTSALLERGCLTPFQAQYLIQGEPQKLILGQYVLLEPLGEGGMGAVFKARHHRMKRLVAVKVIRHDTPATPAVVKRFTQEIEAAAHLVHPNVVLAFDANEVDDTLFFVMEYVEGVDLSHLVRAHGPLPVGRACDYIRQAALGLQHAFEKGLVHRDIKPSNLLLAYADGVVKVLDMGLARLQQSVNDSEGSLTRTGIIMGTPDFMSPEQSRDSRTVDIRSDLYSLGCTLYFLLAGRVPFPEGTSTEKLLKHNMEEPRPLGELCPDLPAEVETIVRKLMAKLPEERYQTPGELAAALVPFAETRSSAEQYRPKERVNSAFTPTIIPTHMPVIQPGATAPGPKRSGARTGGATGLSGMPVVEWQTLGKVNLPSHGPTPQAIDGAGRRRTLPLLLGLGMAAGILLAFAAALLWQKFQADPGPAVFIALAPTADPTTASSVAVPPTQPQKPPTGKPADPPIVEVPKPTTPEVGIIVRIRERDGRPKNELLRAGFARDGRWALASWGDQLRFWDLSNPRPHGKATDSRPAFPYPVTAVALGSDGKRALFATQADVYPPPKGKVVRPVPVVGVWSLGSDEDVFAMKGHTGEVTCLALSPRGNLALSGGDDKSVRVWNLETRSLKGTMAHGDTVSCVAYSPDGVHGLSGGWDSKVILWNLETGDRLKVFGGHKNIVSAAAFSPDGRYAVTGGCDNRICIYDVAEQRLIRTLEEHRDRVHCLAFAPDNLHFLSGSEDESVRLWSINDRESLYHFDDHKKPVLGVAYLPDGRYAVSISADNTIQRWELPVPKKP